MEKRVLVAVATSVFSVLAFNGPALSSEVASEVSVASIDGAGRNIMRTADGGIVTAFSARETDRPSLIFGRSLDNGRSWNNVPLLGVNGAVDQVAIDSNFQGSYIAFTETVDGRTVGRIAFSSAPFAANPGLTVSQSVTPDGVVPRDTFLQASRAGWGNLADENRETVVYGWQDAASKGLYIGVSPDGTSFPEAKLVVDDVHATSGPAVAIRGNYVIATYLTTDPAMAVRDLVGSLPKGRAYPAWLESLDGGQTWSDPKPLFGVNSDDFPTVRIGAGDGNAVDYRLAGGSFLPNSPILNWATSRAVFNTNRFISPDKTLPLDQLPLDRLPQEPLPREQLPQQQTPGDRSSLDPLPQTGSDLAADERPLGGITFVQTSMSPVGAGDVDGEISVVSFRPIAPGAEWTHVIANNPLTAVKQATDSESRIGVKGTQFQYSALIDTAVRATTYQETDPGTGESRFVAAVSTDTGKTFNHHVSFSTSELAAFGIRDFDARSVFAASQCLFEDRNGEVYIDILSTKDGEMTFASLPLGVNAAELRTAE
ncbi:MAG: hypothetical protein Tsb0019_28240 [Roseibium sp.]